GIESDLETIMIRSDHPYLPVQLAMRSTGCGLMTILNGVLDTSQSMIENVSPSAACSKDTRSLSMASVSGPGARPAEPIQFSNALLRSPRMLLVIPKLVLTTTYRSPRGFGAAAWRSRSTRALPTALIFPASRG